MLNTSGFLTWHNPESHALISHAWQAGQDERQINGSHQIQKLYFQGKYRRRISCQINASLNCCWVMLLGLLCRRQETTPFLCCSWGQVEFMWGFALFSVPRKLVLIILTTRQADTHGSESSLPRLYLQQSSQSISFRQSLNKTRASVPHQQFKPFLFSSSPKKELCLCPSQTQSDKDPVLSEGILQSPLLLL